MLAYASLKIDTTSPASLLGGVGAGVKGANISVTSKSSVYEIVSTEPLLAVTVIV